MSDIRKIVIDGTEIEADGALTLIQACEQAGVEIPRFCYHERLSIAGNCRMCLVEVVGGPPKPLQRFVKAGVMARWHPPHHKMHLAQNLKPFLSAFVELFVDRAPDKFLKAWRIFPDRQVRNILRIATDLGFGIARTRFTGPFHHPHKARHAFAQPIDPVEVFHELRDPWIINRCKQPSHVKLCQMHLCHCSTFQFGRVSG